MNIEISLFKLLDPLFKAFEVELNTNPHFQPTQLLEIIAGALEKWFSTHLPDLSLDTFDVSSQPVSPFITLHRIFSLFLHIAMTSTNKQRILPVLLSMKPQFHQLLLEQPLRIQVWMAQIKAGMWIRNGWSLFQLEAHYHAQLVTSGTHFQADLFMLQVCSITNRTDFLNATLQRFGLANKQKNVFSGTVIDEGKTAIQLAPKEASKMIEELLEFVIVVLTDRTYCCKNNDNELFGASSNKKKKLIFFFCY